MSDYLNVISLAGLAPEDRFPTWRVVMEKKAQGAESFEIHCWDQDADGIDLALQYGQFKDVNWPNGKVITGKVTEEFIHMLTHQSKPESNELYDKMTPFFSIFFDNGFSSEHYGTEMYVWMEEPEWDDEDDE